MKKYYIFILLGFLYINTIFGQSVGDFRSKSTGPANWNDFNSWERYDGSTWLPATSGQLPGSSSAVEIQTGHAIVINATGLASGNLAVNGSLTYHATTVSALTVTGNVTVGGTGSFTSPASGTVVTHALSISGDLTVAGVFDMNVFSTAGVVTTFTGATNNVINGAGTTINFYSIVVNKGTAYTNVLDVTSVITIASPPISGGIRLTITNGTFKLSSASTLSPYAGTQTPLSINGRLWLNNAGATVQSVGVGTSAGVGRCMITTGRLQITAGTFSYGSGNDIHSFAYSGTYLTLDGPNATLNIYGGLQLDYALTFTMSAGNINIYPQAGNNLTTWPAVNMAGYFQFTTNYQLTGGTMTIVDPPAASSTYAALNCVLTNGTYNMSGFTIRLGDGTSDKPGGVNGFLVNSSVPLGNVIVNNSTTSVLTTRVVKLNGGLNVGGVLTINSGTANQFLLNGNALTLGGNLVNTGTFTGDGNATNSIVFNGTTQQVVSGTGTFTNGNINNITLNNTSGASPSADLQVPLSVSNSMTLTNGSLGTTNASVFTIGRSASSTTFTLTRSGGSLSLTPAFALPSGTTSYTYSAPIPPASITTGGELPTATNLTSFTINNSSGVILNKAVSATTLALTSGILTSTSTNSITVSGSATANITGGSATAYVNGPLTRTLPNNATAANYKFFIGKTGYRLFEYETITTGGTGTATITAEAFDAGPYPATPGIGLSAINTDKYWALSGTLGSVTITSSRIRITESGLVSTNKVGQSNASGGTYDTRGGVVTSTTISTSNPIDYSAIATGTYFRIGTQGTFASGNYAIGPSGPYAGYVATFATFQAAINAVTDVTLAGNVIFEFQPDYAASGEVFPVAMTSYLLSGSGATVTFRPASTVISPFSFTSTGTILTNAGADYITFDGRAGGSGSSQLLQFTNTGTSASTIVLSNDAQYNQFLYCVLKGSSTAASTGILTINAPTAGNNFYTIDHCAVDASSSANNCILATGTGTDATITNNNFFDFRNGAGINLASGSNNAVIDNNSFYQTATYTGFAGTTSGIVVSGGNNVRISNNNIGGNGPGVTGTWEVSSTAPAVYNFTGINATNVATTSKIFGNKIQNFAWSSNPATWTGISATGTVNIGTDGTNYIGSNTGNDNIKITYYANGAAQVTGINAGGTTVNVQNNNIGSITMLLSGVTGVGTSFTGIAFSATTSTISGNVIGSATTALSINGGNQSTVGNAQYIYGINCTGGTTMTISGNTIANLCNGMTFASANTGMVRGIRIPNTGSTINILSNTIYSLSTPQPMTGAIVSGSSNHSVVGIDLNATNATTFNVTGNAIYDLVNSAATGAVNVLGIYCQCYTSGATKFDKNTIHSFSTLSNAAVQTGMYLNYGTCTVQNNLVRLGIDKTGSSITSTAQINGIFKASTSACNFYFNTVYIGGSGVAAGSVKSYAFVFTAKATAAEDVRNNIFVNMRTNSAANKLNYAISLPSITSSWTCDYNIYNVSATDGILASFAAADKPTIGSLQEAYPGADLHSGFGDPLLTNPTGTSATLSLLPLNTTPAEGTGTAIGSVTDDNTGALRSGLTPTDIGAYAGNFTPPGPGQDIWFPIITYTKLLNTGLTTNRTTVNFATATDYFTGVNTTPGTKPRLYYKKSTDANAFPGNTSSDNGWKWVEANNSTSPFDFTIDYSIINGGSVVIGDVIQYFVVAQDLATTPNVSFNPSTGASGTSVSPAGMTAPATPNSYGIVPTIASSVNVGTGYTYTTLTGTLGSGGLFAAINAGVINSNVVATIKTDMVEPGTVGLNLIIEEGPNAGTLTLTIQGDGVAHLVSGTTSPYTVPLIPINGACRVTIDGGAKLLTFRNANAAYNTTGPVIQFNSGSQNCVLKNCIIESNAYAIQVPYVAAEVLVGTTGVNSVTINNNDIRDSRGAVAGPERAGIYSNSATNTLTITNNNIYNFRTAFNTETSYGIYLNAVANGCTVTGNSVFTESGTNPVCGMIGIFIGSGNNHTVTGNFVGGSGPGCTGTWTSTINAGYPTIGIYIGNGTAPASNIQGNTIQSFNIAGNPYFYGIENINGVANFVGNVIGSATVANSIQLAGTVGLYTSYGIINQTPTGGCNFDQNTIANITLTAASGAPSFRAMQMNGGNVRKNKIFNIGASNAAATPAIYGIYNTSGFALNEFSNNLIALNGGASTNPTLYGFYDASSAAGTTGFYFNSISLYGTASGTAGTYAFYRNAAASYILNNNILANQRTGGTGSHYAIFSVPATSFVSNYNDLYTAGAAFGSFGGSAKANFAAWQAIPLDLNSFNVNPSFVSSTDLHTAVPQLNNGGVSIAGITTDLSNVVRSNPPDIGVYEFTLPITSINTLAATAIGKTTATVNGNINTNNENVTMSFEYGLTPSYGNTKTGVPPTVRSLSSIPVSAALSSLAPNTLYHYRLKGASATSTEIAYGLDMTFVTLPDPTITGPSPVCVLSTGNIYTTEAGNSNYVWLVSSGGTITAGGGLTDNTVTVTWNAGGSQWVSINYNNSAGFPAPSATVFNVTFLAAPVPTLTGPVSVCEGTLTNVYTTETSMANYVWIVTDGNVVSGGTSTDNTITIDWITPGTGHVFVDYTNANGCTAVTPTDLPVTVNALPVPVITGPGFACTGTSGNVYSTAGGMTGYTWAVSAGATITAGGTSSDNSATVTWGPVGTEWVSVNYTDLNGCTAVLPTIFDVTVNPLLPVSVSIAANLSGPICPGTSVTFTATPANGGTTPSYQWYNGATPVGTNSPGFTTSALNNGDNITVVLTSSEICQSGGPATSNIITMNVLSPLTASVAGSNQVICYATTASPLSATVASGGSGPYTYQWQSSPDGLTGWADITGETGLTYSPGVMFASTSYRIIATDNGAPSCGSVISNVVTVTVNDPILAPVLSASQTICYNYIPAQLTATPATGGTGPFTYQWQMKTTGSWSNVGTNSLTYQPPTLTLTTQYRVIAVDAGVPHCGSALSNTVIVTVQADATAGSIAADQAICSGSAPAALTSTGVGTGSGTITYEWEYSTDGGTTWTLITGANSDGYAPGALTQTTLYHRITVSTLNLVACRSLPTVFVTITVNPVGFADFVAGNLFPQTNLTVNFTDLSTGTPLTWDWNFLPGTVIYVGGTNANSQNPQVQFTASGDYTVSLTVNAATCPNTMTKTAYIYVGIPGLWTGATSNVWNDPTNWDNHYVPDILTDVTIPSAAAFWPVFTGNLTVGTTCKSIVLTNVASELTITGDLVILNGFSVTNSGTINLQGNLDNQNPN